MSRTSPAPTGDGWIERRLRRWALRRPAEPLPIHLHRRRIYVLPTRFGLFYFALVLTMTIGALNYNNNPALLLALLLGSAGLASLVHAHLQLSGLQVVALAGAPVHAGETIPLQVHARADDGRPRHGLRLGADGTAAATRFSLAADGRGDAVLPLPTRQRGWMALPVLTLSTTRPLGLARAWANLRPDQRLLVYPRPERPPPPLPLGADARGRMQPRADADDLRQLRDYRHGDARHRIAWKPSARHGQLLVREHEQPQAEACVLDWAATAGLPDEARLSRLTAWVEQAHRRELTWSLRLPGHPLFGPDRGEPHRHACLQALAQWRTPGGDR